MINYSFIWSRRFGLIVVNVLLLILLTGCEQGVSPVARSRIYSLNDENSATREAVDPSKMWAEPAIRKLPYTLRGKRNSIRITVYKGLDEYLDGLPRVLKYDEPPSAATDFKADWLRYVQDQSQQKEGLHELISEIRKAAFGDDDRARIAISLVQNIPFDTAHWERQVTYAGARFPYQVLYDQAGVCGEKSLLLSCILKELGFGTAVMDFEAEKHRVLGVKVPYEFGYYASGYCFIESTGPQIPTDALGVYSGERLQSRPEIVVLNDGKPLTTISEEAKDAQSWQRFREEDTLSTREYRQWLNLARKYGLFSSTVLDSLGRMASVPQG
jgi:hypothetical protein